MLGIYFSGTGNTKYCIEKFLECYNENKEIKLYSIEDEKCISCGKCANLCPMNNIIMENDKPVAKNQCTSCYRCINNCPKKAITLIGKNVVEQCKIDKYIDYL